MTKKPKDQEVARETASEDTRRAYSTEEMPAEHLAMLEQALENSRRSRAKKPGRG